MSGDPKDDKLDNEAEYNRLARLFRERWELAGTQQIVNAIAQVAFHGATPEEVVRTPAVQGTSLVVNQRNIQAVATFGAAIPSDLCTYI